MRGLASVLRKAETNMDFVLDDLLYGFGLGIHNAKILYVPIMLLRARA